MSLILTKIVMISMVNDKFRKSGLGVTMTNGVIALPDVCGLMQSIRTYDDFTESNDPYGEHDFGSLDWHGNKVFWKIDYYNKTLDGWADPLTKECQRVLTVMLSDEY
jgi:hypothetical protein